MFALRKMTESAKKKKKRYSIILKKLHKTNEASSSDSTPLLKNTSGTSQAKKRTETKVSCIFEIQTVI